MDAVKQITPFVMTHDLDNALAFFTDVLEFDCTFRMENYAFLACPGGALRLLEVEHACAIGEQMIYIDCTDVDGFYAHLKPALDRLPTARVRAPFNQPYNMREFHVKDPDNCLLMFGKDIPPSP